MLVETPTAPLGVPRLNEGTLTPKLCELTALLASPEYEATIVDVPVSRGAMNVTEQVPAASVQLEVGEKAPELLVNVTVPVGESPVTVDVHLVDAPPANAGPAQVKAVVDGWS